ncbi:MAG: SDR family oxidoreductase [SAR324 cluster bacterium]|nr:SDR family oxidoreductase [SAR324 cluster bacterium]
MNKVMLVTGGSRGIGAAAVRLGAKHGYAVAINYEKQADVAQNLMDEINDGGGKAIIIQANVSVESEIIEMFNQVDQQLGTLTAFVNNAGIIQPPKPLVEMTRERLQELFDVNILGAVLCAREAVKRMSTRLGGSGGAIVNLSSAAAKMGGPNSFLDYAASKGAIDTFTNGLGQEVANEGIRVNGIRPGLIYTDIHASLGDPDRVKRLENVVPMKRGGLPGEVAEAIMWLLSPEASYVTASTLDVGGGR